MKIRTRYTLFKAIIVVAILVFLATLYDMFQNASEWIAIMFLLYAVLAVFALLLYIGWKPNLDEEEAVVSEVIRAEPEPPAAVAVAPPPGHEEPLWADEIVEVPRRRTPWANLQGPHHFKCPLCANVFALEASHIQRKSDFRLNCPYCGNDVKIPHLPHMTRAKRADVAHARADEKGMYTCTSCGEIVRVTAPGSALERLLNIKACPNCSSRQMTPATPG